MNNNNPIDPKYIGVPNICFSLTKNDDDRDDEYSKQRIERGFDDSEIWSLDYTIACFIIPRLKGYKEIHEKIRWASVQDATDEDIDEEINDVEKMIRAFELVARDNCALILTDDEWKEYSEGIQLFTDNFLELWW